MIAEACDGLAAPAPVKKGRSASSKSASKSTAAPSSAEDSAKPASSGRKGHKGGNHKRKKSEAGSKPFEDQNLEERRKTYGKLATAIKTAPTEVQDKYAAIKGTTDYKDRTSGLAEFATKWLKGLQAQDISFCIAAVLEPPHLHEWFSDISKCCSRVFIPKCLISASSFSF